MDNVEIYIRAPHPEDATVILSWENYAENWADPEKNGFYSYFDILQLIHELQDIRKAKQGRWMICDKYSNSVVGAADLTDIDFEKETAGVGILIANEKDRNKGIAGKALELLEAEAINLSIFKLIASVLPNNKASLRLFEKRDFNKIGKSDEQFLINGSYLHATIFEKCLNVS